jgi:hypothetical protein
MKRFESLRARPISNWIPKLQTYLLMLLEAQMWRSGSFAEGCRQPALWLCTPTNGKQAHSRVLSPA